MPATLTGRDYAWLCQQWPPHDSNDIVGYPEKIQGHAPRTAFLSVRCKSFLVGTNAKANAIGTCCFSANDLHSDVLANAKYEYAVQLFYSTPINPSWVALLLRAVASSTTVVCSQFEEGIFCWVSGLMFSRVRWIHVSCDSALVKLIGCLI